MRRLPPLSSLRVFEAAARLRSFKEAAKELAVTPTAVSHQIRGLEAHIGVRLFERRARQVILTPSGETLYPVLRDGFDNFAREIAALARSQARPVVTITATNAFTAKWLVPRVSRFQASNPGINLRLLASDHVLPINPGMVDLAIRYGRGVYPGFISTTLVADRFAPVMHPRLNVSRPEELRRVPLINFAWRNPDPAHPTWQSWLREAGLTPFEPASVLDFSDESHAIQAMVAGHGAALLSLVLVQEELAAGLVIQPFGPVIGGLGYHLVEAPGQGSVALAHAKAWLLAEVHKSATDSRVNTSER